MSVGNRHTAKAMNAMGDAVKRPGVFMTGFSPRLAAACALVGLLSACAGMGPAPQALDDTPVNPAEQCLGSRQVVTRYMPLDLYRSAALCMQQNKRDEAVFLYGVAGSEGRFDVQRVTDRTAHQVVNFLGAIFIKQLGEPAGASFSQHMQARLGDKVARKAFCSELKKQPPPSYHPAYMLNHGMQAFLSAESASAVQALPDAQKAWSGAVDTYMDCGQ